MDCVAARYRLIANRPAKAAATPIVTARLSAGARRTVSSMVDHLGAYNERMGPTQLDDRGVVIACPSCGQRNRLAYERLGDPVRCGKCKTSIAAPNTPIEIASTADF